MPAGVPFGDLPIFSSTRASVPTIVNMEGSIRPVSTEIPLKLPATSSAALAPLPELPYSPRDHKKGIAIKWIMILVNTCFVPLGLTYGLWFGTSPQINQHLLFGITTIAFSVASAIQYWMRMYRLLIQDPIYRPIGSKMGWVWTYRHPLCVVALSTN